MGTFTREGRCTIEDSMIEEPDYLDGRYVYDPDLDDNQAGADPEGTGIGPEGSRTSGSLALRITPIG